MNVSLYKYNIPLPSPLLMRGGVLNHRTGWLIETPHGWGEISPLPGFSQESTAETESEVMRFVHSLKHGLSYTPKLASCAFAQLMLSHQLEQYTRAQPYNFVLGAPKEAASKVLQLYTKGARIFKLKTALYNSDEEHHLFNYLVKSMPDASFIIDANCSLTPPKAQEIAHVLGAALLYIEDPCSDISSSLDIKIPLGMDELMRSSNISNLRLIRSLPSNCKLVQKPTMNWELCVNILPHLINPQSDNDFELIRIFKEKLVLSSSFESIFGIAFIERLAKMLGLSAPGTDTLRYFPEAAQTPEGFLSRYVKKTDFD